MKVSRVLILCIAGVAALIGAATAIMFFRNDIADFLASMKEKYLGHKKCDCEEFTDFADM